MSDQKKISRRDAIKLISAATGASVLANLPAKWSTPELTSAAMPAYAQTSCDVTVTMTANGADIDYRIRKFQGPATDTDTFTDDITYNFLPLGTQAVWSCKSGCLELQFLDDTGFSWEVVISTPGGIPTVLNFQAGFQDLLVNLETGAYSTDVNDNTGVGCDWLHD